MRKLCPVFILVLFFSCTATKKTISLNDKSTLQFIGKYELPHKMQFKETTIGGLSGIDYNKKNQLYYLISDDRSSINAARFYTAKIFLTDNGIDSVKFMDVRSLLRADGSVYPDSKLDPLHSTDPEGIRYDVRTNQLVWTSEGERIMRKNDTVLVDPSIIIMDTDGKYMDRFQLPSNMHMQMIEKGPRQNGVFEGLTFMKNYRDLMVSVEEPLYDDGPRAGTGDSSGWIRMIRLDVRTKKPIAQYGYKIDPVAYPANPAGAFKINGVPDIFAVNDQQLLVLERSFSTGRIPCTIKIYMVSLDNAEDISSIADLRRQPFHAIQKRMLFNMDNLGINIDNVEGICFGPVLPGGRQSVILVADDNFSKDEVTQFFLFALDNRADDQKSNKK
jgi:hypothetical protein